MDTKNTKFALLSSGISIDPTTVQNMNLSATPAMNSRTGFSDGLEFALPDGTWVNASLVSCDLTPFAVRRIHDDLMLCKSDESLCKITLALRPHWYDSTTSNGIKATLIGTLRADRLAVSLVKDCIYFQSGTACHFCAIKYNPRGEIRIKPISDIVEVVTMAVRDPVIPAAHIYFNLGNTDHPERGLDTYEDIITSIRQITDIPIHLNQTAPRTADYTRYLHDLGFNEVSFNVEFIDQDISRHLMPGKHEDIGLRHCLEMLDSAVQFFGVPNVSSCLVVGLEEPRTTLYGVAELLKRGVVPKLSVFRPLRGSVLAHTSRPALTLLQEVYEGACELSSRFGIPLGPLCEPCKLLSLA